MNNSKILFQRDNDIVRIILNRPESANALDIEMAQQLLTIATECDFDPTVRCVMLTGAGKSFCAGGDVEYMRGKGEAIAAATSELASVLHLAMTHFVRMRKPFLTIVNGAAAGAGYGLALSGDVVLMARSASFTPAYAALGVSPDGGLTWLLPRLIGLRRAQEILIANRKVYAEQAESMGLITRVIDDDALSEESFAFASRLACSATGAIGNVRALLLGSYCTSWESHIEIESRSIAAAIAGPEGQVGVKAFAAGKKANFSSVNSSFDPAS